MRKCISISCSGTLELLEWQNFLGYFIVSKERCTACLKIYNASEHALKTFENNVNRFNEFKKLKYSLYNQKTNAENWDYWNNITEITTQHILAHSILPAYQVISMDTTGEKRRQYDLLAINKSHSVAIEVTQAANQIDIESTSQLHNVHNNIKFSDLNFEWCLGFYSDFNPAKKKNREKIFLLLKKLEEVANKVGDSVIDCSNANYYSLQEHDALASLGIHSFNAFKGDRRGNVYFVGPSESWRDNNPDCIFKIINTHANKKDNLNKLAIANTNERHLFIPITKFHSEAASYIYNMTNKPQVFNRETLEKRLGTTCLISESIDIVWIGTFFNFNENGNIGYRLAKVYKEGQNIIFAPTTTGITLYQ